MGAIDATFAAVKAVYTADTDGLNLAGDSAHIVDFLRHGDAKRNPAMPSCYVHVTPMRSFDNRAGSMQAVRVVFEVRVPSQQDFTRNDAIVDRLRTKYHDVQLSATGGYSFSKMVWLSSEIRPQNDERVLIETYDLLVFATGSGPYLGYDADFSADFNGDVIYWELNEFEHKVNDTRPADTRMRWLAGETDGHGYVRVQATDLPPDRGLYRAVNFTVASGKVIQRDILVLAIRTAVQFGVGRPTIYDVQFAVTEVDPA